MDFTCRPIGILRSPFHDLNEMPVQATDAASAPGTAESFPEHADWLKDLDGSSQVMLLNDPRRAQQVKVRLIPFLDPEERGVFSRRAIAAQPDRAVDLPADTR